jgi:hypothetical protein
VAGSGAPSAYGRASKAGVRRAAMAAGYRVRVGGRKEVELADGGCEPALPRL